MLPVVKADPTKTEVDWTSIDHATLDDTLAKDERGCD